MAVKASNSSVSSIELDKSIDTSWRKNKALYRLFFKSLRPYRSFLFNILLVFIFLGTIEVIFPFIVQHGLENFMEIRSWENFYFYAGIILILLAIRFCFQFLEQYLTINFATLYSNKVKKIMFSSLANRDITHINEFSPGQLIAKITFNTSLIKMGLEQWGLNLAKQLIFLIGLLIFSLFLNTQFFLITLAVLPIIAVSIWAIHRSMRHYINNLQTKNAQITEQLYDLFQSWSTIKLFRLEEQSSKTFNHYVDEDQHFRVRRNIVYSIAHLMIFIFSSIITLALAGLMLKMYLAGETNYSTILLYIFYTAYLTKILIQSLKASTYFESIKIGIITTFRFLPANLRINIKRYGKKTIKHGKIEFKNTSFFFPGTKTKLKKINLNIAAGNKVLLAGAGESGKSCFLQLINGVLKPIGGKILIDGLELKNLSPTALSEQIAYLTPEKRFLEGTIFSNVSKHKKPSLATSTEVHEIIEELYAFGASKLVNKYKQRLSTKISNQSHLSHNESLLLIAMRALKSHPPIILLDNFFAGADPDLTKTILNYIDKYCSKSTIIYADYQENDYFPYDQILHLNNGQLIHQ